ncbi:MAG: AI-2E family transporter [Candidatus Limnocylindrales bacterium]
MDEPAELAPEDAAQRAARWAASLPPPPFVDASAGDHRRFTPLSPRVAVLIAAGIFLAVLLLIAQDSVRPFIVGLLFVYLLDPPVRWLARHGLRRSIAILVVYAGTIVVVAELLLLTVAPLINELLRFIADFPTLAADLDKQVQKLSELYARLDIPPAIRDWIDGILAGIGQPGGAVSIDLSFLLPVLTGAGSLIGILFGYLILPVWVAYLLNDRVALVAQFDRALPASWRFDVWAVIRTIERVFGQWVRGQLILGVAVAIFTFVGLLVASEVVDPIFGRYAILLSVIAGVLELIPIIGPIISAVPAVLLAATVGPGTVVAALVLYTLVQQVENNFLVPKIQGDSVELHPSLVMFAILVGGSLAGLLGAILALPMTAAFRDVVRYLFRRLSPDDPSGLAISLANIGMGPDDG